LASPNAIAAKRIWWGLLEMDISNGHQLRAFYHNRSMENAILKALESGATRSGEIRAATGLSKNQWDRAKIRLIKDGRIFQMRDKSYIVFPKA
jgi:hypothetical protein